MRSYEKIEQYDTEITASLAENYKKIIGDLGEDVHREGLEKTPERVAKASSAAAGLCKWCLAMVEYDKVRRVAKQISLA